MTGQNTLDPARIDFLRESGEVEAARLLATMAIVPAGELEQRTPD